MVYSPLTSESIFIFEISDVVHIVVDYCPLDQVNVDCAYFQLHIIFSLDKVIRL